MDSIDLVMRDITPEFFSRQLRPYFDPVRVAGNDYMAPAAAHVPLALIDQVLWAGDRHEDGYVEFQEDSARYAPPHWRLRYEDWADVPSVVTRLTDSLRETDDPQVEAAATALCQALRVLITFRGRHLTNARRAYQAELTETTVGSGGGNLDLLADILKLTRENANLTSHNRAAA